MSNFVVNHPNPYDPLRYHEAKVPKEKILTCLGQVNAILRRMEKTFCVDEFLYEDRHWCTYDLGFTSLENILIFRGCQQIGAEFSFNENSALREKARICASNLNEFTLFQFKEKYTELFLTKKLYLRERGFYCLDQLLRSIPGMTVLRSTPGQEKYFLPRQFHPVWVNVSPSEVAAVKAKKLADFKKKAAGVAKNLGRFTGIDFSNKWREVSDFYRTLNPVAFGFHGLDNLYKTIPGVRFVSRRGEIVKFYYKESDVENEEDLDEQEAEDEEGEQEDDGDLCLEDQKQYPIALKMARTLANPFTEKQLVAALKDQYKLTKGEIYGAADRKLPVFLEMMSGIRHIGDGKYEHDGISEKTAAEEVDESEEDEESASVEDEEESSDGEEGGDEGTGEKEARCRRNNDIVAIDSSKGKVTEFAKTPKRPAKQDKVGTMGGDESDGSSGDSDDSEDGDVSNNGGSEKGEKSSPVKFLKEGKEGDVRVVKNRPSAGQPDEYIEIGSGDDDEPIVKKAKKTASSSQNARKRLPEAVRSEEIAEEQGNGGRNRENGSDRKRKRNSQDETGHRQEVANELKPEKNEETSAERVQQQNASEGARGHAPITSSSSHDGPMIPMFQQGPIPHEQLLVIAAQVQNILMQQGVPGGAGNGNQAMNGQLPPMNPAVQNFWSPQMTFGLPQMPQPMFPAGFPGGFGGPGLPSFGLPPQMFPQVPQMTAPPTHQLPNNILEFLGQYMGPSLPTALQNGANPLDLAKKLLEDVYGNQQQLPPQQ